jgi:methionyl aminopeptidase
MVKLKSNEDIKILREGGKILNGIIKELEKRIKSGANPKEIDWLAENLIKKAGGKPAFKGYKPDFAKKKYPSTICFSPNSVVVHGVPDSSLIKEGDIVGIDIGMEYKGLFTDMAITIGVGNISNEAKKIISTTKECLNLAIKYAKGGNNLGDIGWAIETHAKKNGFNVIKALTGHGVGYSPHEEPAVLNFGELGQGMELKSGLVIAIEPMLSACSGAIVELSDGSFGTAENCLSAHFEHTIAITKRGNIVLTDS